MSAIVIFALIVLYLFAMLVTAAKPIPELDTKIYKPPEVHEAHVETSCIYPEAKSILEPARTKAAEKRSVEDFRNTVICGDCLEIMRSLEDSCIDLFVTSPPYNLRNSSGNGMKDGRGGKWSRAALISGYNGYDDAMPYDLYCSWQRKCLSEMMRLLKDDGAIFYNHKWRVQNGLIQDRHEIVQDFPVRQIIIWRRKGGINFNPGYFLPTYEVIYLIAKPAFRLAEKANRFGDVWEIKQDSNNPHPAPYPEELTDRIISSTNAGIIADPFAGSGTTAISAMRFGRDYVLMEKSAEYCSMIETRIKGGEWNAGKKNKRSK